MPKDTFIVYTGFANICFTNLEDAERFKSEKNLDTIIYKHGELNPNIIEMKRTKCSYGESADNMATEQYAYGKRYSSTGFSYGRNVN